MATKIGRITTWCGGTPLSKSCDLLITWSRNKLKKHICSSTIPMAFKLGRIVTCSGGTLPSNSRDLLIEWSRDKFKKNIYTYTTPRPPN